jgi:hypothetical protein
VNPDDGMITITRENRPNGGYLVRVTQADKHVRISLELLELIRAGEAGMCGAEDVPVLRIDGDWVYLSDDYAHQSCYRLGNPTSDGRAVWMEKL